MGLGFCIEIDEKKEKYDHSINAHWSYSGFMRFRKRLSTEAGIDLLSMSGFTTNGKSWDTIEDDIKDLLYHSDCDGKLTPEQCRIIAPRLKELISKWDLPVDYDKQTAAGLVEGMDRCTALNKNLIFC